MCKAQLGDKCGTELGRSHVSKRRDHLDREMKERRVRQFYVTSQRSGDVVASSVVLSKELQGTTLTRTIKSTDSWSGYHGWFQVEALTWLHLLDQCVRRSGGTEALSGYLVGSNRPVIVCML